MRARRRVWRGMVEDSGGKPALRNPIQFLGAQTRSGGAPALGANNAEILGR